MGESNAEQPKRACPSEETLFTALARRESGPNLRSKKIDQILTDLMKLPEVNLSAEQLRIFVNDWHEYLSQAVSAELNRIPDKYILTAYSLVEDHTITLTRETLDELVEAIADWGGMATHDALREAKRRADADINIKSNREYQLDMEIWDAIDILAVVFKMMNKSGLKPFVRDPDLQSRLIDYLRSRSSITLGGAAGNEAYILHQMGLPVLVYSPYHSTNQAIAAPVCAQRLIFDEAGLVLPYPSFLDGNPDDPRRFSFVLQLTETQDADGDTGPVLTLDGQEIRPIQNDRVILRIPNARTPKPGKWKRLRVVWNTNNIEPIHVAPINEDPSILNWDAKTKTWFLEIDRAARIRKMRDKDYHWEDVFESSADSDWPHLSVFQHHPTVNADGVLTIMLASAEKLEAIADNVQSVLLGGIQMFGQIVFTEALTELLRAAWTEQLKALGSKGAALHLELSDVACGTVLSKLSNLFQEAGIRHISTNREELVQITSESGTPCFFSPVLDKADSAFTIYRRAVHLLKALGLDTYYVHDAELDILLRRNYPGEFPCVTTAALEKHRQVMLAAKASVPEALLRRAKVDQEWDLILSTELLAALLAFAEEYTDYIDEIVKGVERAAILKQILCNGYHHHPNPNGISVVVAPAIYVRFDQKVSLVGAGDMCFASRAAMSNSW